MRLGKSFLWLAAGLILGVVISHLYFDPPRPAEAANSSRYEDFIMCTGEVFVSPAPNQTDAVWILDYRTGKLLSTVINRSVGQIVGWAEMDLVREFGIKPRQNVHFMMTTGKITKGQAALYLAETSTGKLGVYTLGPRQDGKTFTIRRHDMVFFRPPANMKKGNK